MEAEPSRPLRASSISRRASPRSRSRRSGFFSRQRRGALESGPALRREAGPVRLLLQDRGQRLRYGFGAEGSLPRKRLIEHAAERPDVRSPVERPSSRLLRAHVGCGSENHAVASHGCDCRRLRRIGGRRLRERLRGPEVQDFDLPSGVTFTLAGFRSR